MAGSSDIHGGGALSGSRGGNARGRSIDDKTAGSSSKPRYRRTLDAASEKLLRRLNGKDVKMHPSIGRRKKRMCIVLPGQVSLSAAGGTIGMLEKLNTKEPVLYVDFPNGRLRFNGRVVHPKTKYMSVAVKKDQLVCENIFDSLIVFSSSAWVGTKEDNPTEKELPMPDSLTKKLHDAKNFGDAIAAPVKGHGADANDTDVNKDDEKQSKPPESPIVLD